MPRRMPIHSRCLSSPPSFLAAGHPLHRLTHAQVAHRANIHRWWHVRPFKIKQESNLSRLLQRHSSQSTKLWRCVTYHQVTWMFFTIPSHPEKFHKIAGHLNPIFIVKTSSNQFIEICLLCAIDSSISPALGRGTETKSWCRASSRSQQQPEVYSWCWSYCTLPTPPIFFKRICKCWLSSY